MNIPNEIQQKNQEELSSELININDIIQKYDDEAQFLITNYDFDKGNKVIVTQQFIINHFKAIQSIIAQIKVSIKNYLQEHSQERLFEESRINWDAQKHFIQEITVKISFLSSKLSLLFAFLGLREEDIEKIGINQNLANSIKYGINSSKFISTEEFSKAINRLRSSGVNNFSDPIANLNVTVPEINQMIEKKIEEHLAHFKKEIMEEINEEKQTLRIALSKNEMIKKIFNQQI